MISIDYSIFCRLFPLLLLVRSIEKYNATCEELGCREIKWTGTYPIDRKVNFYFDTIEDELVFRLKYSIGTNYEKTCNNS